MEYFVDKPRVFVSLKVVCGLWGYAGDITAQAACHRDVDDRPQAYQRW